MENNKINQTTNRQNKVNTSNKNTGNGNKGNGNTSTRNTSTRNTSTRNTGNGNTGTRNTGNVNTSNVNTGNGNTGNGNTGNVNTGNVNTGNVNTSKLNAFKLVPEKANELSKKVQNSIENSLKKPKNQNMVVKSELVNLFLEMLMTIKVYHWRTYSYADHKASDKLYDSLNKNIDKFVEIILGKNNFRLSMKGRKIDFLDPSSKKDIKDIIYSYKITLEKNMNKYINVERNTDLLNIRDEILGELNQFLYLLSFSM